MDLIKSLLLKLARNELTESEFRQLLNTPDFSKALDTVKKGIDPSFIDKKIEQAIANQDYRSVLSILQSSLPEDVKNVATKSILTADFVGQTPQSLLKQTGAAKLNLKTYPVHVELNEVNVARLKSAYQKAYQDILETLEKSTDFSASRKQAIMQDIQAKLQKLNSDSQTWVNTNIPAYYTQGSNDALHQLNVMGAGVKNGFTFSKVHENAVLSLVDDTNNSIATAIQGVYRDINRVISDASKQAIEQQIITGVVSGDALREVKKQIVGTLRVDGITSLVDRGGKKWELDRYAEMLVRTKAVEARNTGMTNKMVENGYDLVQVSSHQSDHFECAVWEGKILSVTGETKGYPTVQDAIDEGLFHPNCQHAINTVVPALAKETKAYNMPETDFDPPFKENKPAPATKEWEPSMTIADANRYIKNSAFKETVYHGTNQANAKSIIENGFDISKSDPEGRFGLGVYLTDDKGMAQAYTPVKGQILPVKLNVNKVKELTEQEFERSLMTYLSITEDKDLALQAFTKGVLDEFDAVRIVNGRGNSTFVVYRPESMVVVRK